MKNFISLLVIGFMTFCSANVFSQGTKASWTTDIIADVSGSEQPVICSDSLGHLHVAWSDGVGLYYGTNQSGGWGYFRQIDGYSSSECYVPVITADEYGWAYTAARFYYSGYRIKYTTNKEITTGTWTRYNQMSSGHFHEVSVEVDDAGSTHVFAQEDNSGSNVYYQNLDPADVVIPGGTSAYYSTTIDQDDVLHFTGSHSDAIWYTNNSSGSWSAAVEIDGLAESAGQPSVICDADGNLHVVFMQVTTSEIYYLNNIGGSWNSPVKTTGTGIWPDIVIDENGIAHVAYHTTGGGLYYMNNIGGSWNTPEFISTVSLPDDVAHVDSKIALDLKNSTVNIVYISAGNTVTVASTSDYELRSAKSTDTTSTLTSNSGTITTDTISVSATGTVTLLDFTITDAGGDGEPTKIEEFVFQRGQATSDFRYLTDFFQDMTLEVSDATSIACNLYSYKAIAGTENAVWKSIPDGGSLNFTLKGTLLDPLSGVIDSTFQIMINGLHDVLIDNTGSGFSSGNSNIFSDTLYFELGGFIGSGTEGDPYLINNLADLKQLSENSDYWDKHFRQTADIDALETSTWDGGDGFSPVGSSAGVFTGSYDGNSYIINGLYINRPLDSYIGFSGNFNGVIENLGLTNVNITGGSYTGGLVGQNSGTITDCFVSGTVTGNQMVGGISGFANGDIYTSYSIAEVSSGTGIAGGFVGYLFGSTVESCYSTGDVIRSGGTSTEYGGFCGRMFNGFMYNSYSTGNVFDSDGSSNFATDKGFVGNDTGGTYVSNFFDNESANQLTATGATGAVTAAMQSYTTYYNSGWDFMNETDNGTNDYWGLNELENGGYPFLAWQGFTHSEVDKLPPDLVTKNTVLELDGTGHGTLDPADVVDSASDNVALKDTVLSQSEFTDADVGDVTIDVTVSDMSDNTITKSALVTVTLATSAILIQEIPLKIYPNPVSDILNVEFSSENVYKVQLLDITGRKIIEIHNPGSKLQMDMTGLNSGLFIINIEGEKGIINELVIKH